MGVRGIVIGRLTQLPCSNTGVDQVKIRCLLAGTCHDKLNFGKELTANLYVYDMIN